MEAPRDKLSIHCGYNVGGISVTPGDMSREIKKRIPGFEITYEPDFRQEIAESWPDSIDDSISSRDWGLTKGYDLVQISEIMLEEVISKLNQKSLN